MDQMASALGHKAQLLSLLCQPALVQPAVHIPPHVRFWGIDSGVRHSVGGADYGSVRAATFMARTWLRALLKERGAPDADLEHLVHVSPSRLAELEGELPTAIDGATFLAAHASHGDTATSVEPSRTYDLRGCARHPVHEHFRVGLFRELLRAKPSKAQLISLGELMFQSHVSYSAVGLGSEMTDAIVRLVRERGAASGLYGAKITGGGSGGTVCVLGDDTPKAAASLQAVLADYKRLSGHAPHVFSGSSVGAVAFGHVAHHPERDAQAEPARQAAGKRKARE